MFKSVFLACLMLIAGCGGSDTRVCFNTGGGCDLFSPGDPPRADAGADAEVEPAQTVTLDGSESRGDSKLTDFVWAQESGPPVAIVNATQSIASFTAPSVSDRTTLIFRLVVTDEDNRNDDDVVRVTVVPVAVSAMRDGLAQLQKQLRPDPLGDVDGTLGSSKLNDSEFIGLWLAARLRADELGFEPTPVVLLDELRVVIHDVVASSLTREPLLALGLQRTRSYTQQRDPATSELVGNDELGMDNVQARLATVLGNPEDSSLIAHIASADGEPKAIAAATFVLLERYAAIRCAEDPGVFTPALNPSICAADSRFLLIPEAL